VQQTGILLSGKIGNVVIKPKSLNQFVEKLVKIDVSTLQIKGLTQTVKSDDSLTGLSRFLPLAEIINPIALSEDQSIDLGAGSQCSQHTYLRIT
jgi:hypothetical protein